jgi:uncharacterized protein YggE
MNFVRIAALALLVLGAAAVAGIGRPELAGGAERTALSGITVIGTGSAESVPDEALFSLGVSTNGASARAALAANSAAMRRVLAALERAGVDKKDIKTETVSVSPDYDIEGKSPGGFVARNSVSVRVRDLGRASAILDAASQAGANEVHGPMLSTSDRESFEAEALRKAFSAARKRAEALADAAGVEVGAPTAIVEGFSAEPMPLAARAIVDSATSAPIEPGTEEIQATVTVTFAIE